MVCSRRKNVTEGFDPKQRSARPIEEKLCGQRFVAVASLLATVFVGLNALLQAIAVVLKWL